MSDKVGEFGVSNHVVVRNSFGQFISECEAAASRTVDDILDEGVALSRDFAPIGPKDDKRTTPLKDSFFVRKISRTSGVWGNFARHALVIEKGARPHLITGSPYLQFFWEEKGRMWIPGLAGTPDVVHHPGNAAQPYMRPAYKIVMRRAMEIASRNYPNAVR